MIFIALLHHMLNCTPHANKYRKKNANVHIVTMAIIDHIARFRGSCQSLLLSTNKR